MVSAKIFSESKAVGYRKRNRKEEIDLEAGGRRRFIIYVAAALIYYAAVIIIFNDVLMISWVPTGSMAGTINPGDNLICTRFGVGEEEIERYDILIFIPPDKPEMLYVKRVIGLPGEVIEVKNGKVYADGAELDDSFIKAPQNRKGDGIYVVPENCYFFLGDNRNNSNDSRFWQEKYVPAANIQAKARCVIYPFADAGWL